MPVAYPLFRIVYRIKFRFFTKCDKNLWLLKKLCLPLTHVLVPHTGVCGEKGTG